MGFELPFVIGPEYIAVALFGVVIGIIFGAIPGMTATMAVAVFLPLTYAYSMEMALYLLLGLYVGGISGGLVPAILINIPGTPSSVCTTFDGHPMALRGEGERALKIGVTSSFMGGMISLVVLALFTPILAGWAIKFSAVEKFLIILFALTVIAALSRGQMLRGLWIGMLGVLVAMMNQFSVNNEYRMVPEFLESQMQSGFQLFPVLIGLFAVSEMLQQCETGMHASYSKDDTLEVKNNVKFSLLHDFKGQIINVFRSALLGTFMGILPGVGGSAASLIAYSQAKSWSKHPELLGTGVPEGLIASESSNNGLTGGALVPLLSLGIPGDSTTAVLIGAFMLQGIQVGPLFITNNPVIWNTILVALLCCNTPRLPSPWGPGSTSTCWTCLSPPAWTTCPTGPASSQWKSCPIRPAEPGWATATKPAPQAPATCWALSPPSSAPPVWSTWRWSASSGSCCPSTPMWTAWWQ